MAAKLSSKHVRKIRETLSKGNKTCICCFCGEEFPVEQLTIEHIVPKYFGGTNKISNLTFSCLSCNLKRGVANFVEFALYKSGIIKTKPSGAVGTVLWRQISKKPANKNSTVSQ